MLTLIEHVSSVSKSTIESPPLASSALFGGRNRATTAEHVSLLTNLKLNRILYHTLDGVASIGRAPRSHVVNETVEVLLASPPLFYLRHAESLC